MTIDLSTLNENQRFAVEWQDGPLLVLAGPGSGKTMVLTYRIARMIEEKPSDRFKILGLTFTNKAAGEMRERIANLVPDAPARTLLTTFHSFCADLLRQHGHHIGLRPDFTILSQEGDRQAVLEEAISEASASAEYGAERLLPLIGRLLDNNVAAAQAEQVLVNSGIPNAGQLATIYSTYRAKLIKNNRLDFGSLIAESIRLLADSPGIQKQIQRVYPYICVDEFQDTNLCQYLVLRHLVHTESKNLFVVADDDQIIYQWNGASPERLEALQKEFSMEVVQLPENYRCPPAVIDLANRLIVHNIGRSVGKQALLAHKPTGEGSPVRVLRFDTFDQEAEWVAKDIAARPGTVRSECAVLARTKKVLDTIIGAIESAGLSGYLSVRKDEFVSPQLQWMHGMLRLANARQDREQLRRVCKAFYSLEGINLETADVVSAAAAEDGDYLRAFRSMAVHRAELSVNARVLLDGAVNALADRLEFRGFIQAAFVWFGGLTQLAVGADGGTDEFADERDVWVTLTNEVDRKFGPSNVTLHLVLQELDLQSKTPPPPKGAIPCFTIHASKGMEFGHVYLVGVVEDQLPSWAAKKKGDDSREMQEERRNCFVAITRAQESLTITWSGQMSGWAKEPSRFLKEMQLV
jgi:DNA helicase-2/ATP-dependent DNA helicase PcrA